MRGGELRMWLEALAASLTIMAVITTLVVLVGNKIEAESCTARWGDVGRGADYGFLQGCMVTLSDGRRLPASALREMDLR